MEICTVATRSREEMVDITGHVCAVIREKGWRRGVAALFCPHTTCGLTINEGADPDVRRDMTAFFSRTIPHGGGWRYGAVPVRDCGGRRTAPRHMAERLFV